jgi:hypothetical protein
MLRERRERERALQFYHNAHTERSGQNSHRLHIYGRASLTRHYHVNLPHSVAIEAAKVCQTRGDAFLSGILETQTPFVGSHTQLSLLFSHVPRSHLKPPIWHAYMRINAGTIMRSNWWRCYAHIFGAILQLENILDVQIMNFKGIFRRTGVLFFYCINRQN